MIANCGRDPRTVEIGEAIGREWIGADLLLGNLPDTPATSTSTSAGPGRLGCAHLLRRPTRTAEAMTMDRGQFTTRKTRAGVGPTRAGASSSGDGPFGAGLGPSRFDAKWPPGQRCSRRAPYFLGSCLIA